VAEPEWVLTDGWAGRTAAFRKVSEVVLGKDWSDQPFVWRRTRPDTLGRARMAAGLARSGDFGEISRRVRALLAGRRPGGRPRNDPR
jgi:hypothetical protein